MGSYQQTETNLRGGGGNRNHEEGNKGTSELHKSTGERTGGNTDKAPVRADRTGDGGGDCHEPKWASVPFVLGGDDKPHKRTESVLRETILAKRFRVGTKVRILRRSLDKSYNLIVRKIDNGVVTEIHPHFFVVQIGTKRECFRWNEVLGNESTKITIL